MSCPLSSSSTSTCLAHTKNTRSLGRMRMILFSLWISDKHNHPNNYCPMLTDFSRNSFQCEYRRENILHCSQDDEGTLWRRFRYESGEKTKKTMAQQQQNKNKTHFPERLRSTDKMRSTGREQWIPEWKTEWSRKERRTNGCWVAVTTLNWKGMNARKGKGDDHHEQHPRPDLFSFFYFFFLLLLLLLLLLWMKWTNLLPSVPLYT